MGEMKHVKVDNWGAFFLQKLKHFFNRTDYCDLTLQFQDNAQLKVHRLVLNACTEYFEVLERTCEMYEDCLIMPDDLQADVVVPIVNFMYTGQLEYKQELLNRLYQTAQIMNMSVLTKLLDAHRSTPQGPAKPAPPKYKQPNPNSYSRASSTPKRVESRVQTPARKVTAPLATKPTPKSASKQLHSIYTEPVVRQNSTSRRHQKLPARPTRYEIPEELDREDIFDNSFSDLSYESKPLVTHPLNEYAKQKEDEGPSTSNFRNIMKRPAGGDMVEFKRLKTENSLFDDNNEFLPQDYPLDDPFDFLPKTKQHSNQQQPESSVIEMGGAKVTIETKPGNDKPIDHAKIISEVLKKYPHLVKNNKNIKLKIVNNPKQTISKSVKKVTARIRPSTSTQRPNIKKEERDYVYETDIVDTKEIGRLVALGIENVKGPWLCLICGTPGKALNFTSYHKFRNHLVEVHNERQPSNMCEFCGLKSGKRNHLLHHVYTKHGVPPPPSYHFPRCNQCSYVALTQAFLIKHKMTHNEPRLFTCNVCQNSFRSTTQLLEHIQRTGHKICPDRRSNLQCIYCMKTFLRESNLYAHLKSTHKSLARNDGIIDASDEDEEGEEEMYVKREPVQEESGQSMEEDEEDIEENYHQYQAQQEFRNVQIINKNLKVSNQKILNQSLSPVIEKKRELMTAAVQQRKLVHKTAVVHQTDNENIILMNEDYQQSAENEYIISDIQNPELECENVLPEVHLTQPGVSSQLLQKVQPPQLINKPINHPYQIVVSSEQEYKALMAANPSIIFHDGTESRAMTVMGHPSQSIQLDTTQNNMMLIQDDYQVNVSESLSGTNSNIVVVYSQNMQPQGLQFSEQQIAAEQNMSTQLIPTPEVITTNEASDVLQSDMIIEQADDHWQGEVQETITSQLVHQDPMTCNIEIKPEPVAIPEQTPTVIDNGLTEETELQIMGQSAGTTSESVTDSLDIIEEHSATVHDKGVHKFNKEQTLPEHIGNGRQSVITEPCEESVLFDNQHNIPDGMLSQMEIEHEEHISETENPDLLPSVEEHIEENPVTSVESEISQNIPEDEITLSHEVVKERIKDLTADWSDDETPKGDMEDVSSANATIQIDQTISQPADEVATTDTSELEESIENIQEEMKNQVPCTPPSKRIIITSDITLPNTAAAALISKSRSLSAEKTESIITTVPDLSDDSAPTNKITSLLTDWEDNDSQPEANGAIVSSIVEPSQEAEQGTTLTEETRPKVDTVKTVEKIMSDWDEEEEK